MSELTKVENKEIQVQQEINPLSLIQTALLNNADKETMNHLYLIHDKYESNKKEEKTRGIDFNKLKDPFKADEIEWRVQQSGESNNGPWAMVLAYIDNRAILNRLDEVCGPQNWKNEYKTGPDGGILCGLSIKCGCEWVTKWDGAENTDIEAVKGGLSNAQKRAANQWGVGRYLYDLESTWATITTNKKDRKGKTKKGTNFNWTPPSLPSWALPNNTANENVNNYQNQSNYSNNQNQNNQGSVQKNETPEFFPEPRFNAMLDKWNAAIKSGKKTVSEIVKYMKEVKGMKLTENQINILNQIKKEN
jgi:hypothetical protein